MSQVSAILLGAAQDAGLPQAGCNCARCMQAQAYPERHEPVACLGLVAAERKQAWLIDATPDLPTQLYRLLQAAPGSTLAGIMLTHAHIGHYTGLMYLGREAMNASQVPVYATAEMAEFLRGHAPWSDLVKNGNIALEKLTPGQTLTLSAGLQLRPLLVPHRHEHSDTVALLVRGAQKSLFYCPDIDYWSEEAVTEMAGFDVALVDGTFFSGDELPGRDLRLIPHPLVTDSVALLAEVGPAVTFIHLNHTNPLWQDGPERRWLRAQGFSVGRVGRVWRLG